MYQRLTMAEIKRRFDREYVLMVDPVVSPTEPDGITEATVIWHGSDREEGYRRAKGVLPGLFALWLIGEPPGDVGFML